MPGHDRVLIAGGGPVGTITALALARRGIPVTVFDAHAQPAEDHRASTLQPSTLDLLAELGMTEEIVRRGLRSPVFQWRDQETNEIVAEFDFGLLADEAQHPYAIQLEQHKIIHIALDVAARHSGFSIQRPATVLAVSQTADFVEVEVEHANGSREVHRGRYLVGCDGGASTVRKSLGVSFEGFTWPERFNIVTTTHDFERSMGFRYRNYCAHPQRWCALIKVPGEDGAGLWRCLFPAKPEETEDEIISDAWIRARFAECLPAGAPYTLVHHNLYSVQQRVAGSFRAGRIVLAGDAAHVNNPIGGIGMNSGIHDGLNVAEKLDRIWRGADPETLLERYDRQRRLTAIEYVQTQSIANKRIIEERDPEARRRNLDDLRRTAADPAAAREYVRRSSLIAMLEKAQTIQ